LGFGASFVGFASVCTLAPFASFGFAFGFGFVFCLEESAACLEVLEESAACLEALAVRP
jgi:hypothetical protein